MWNTLKDRMFAAGFGAGVVACAITVVPLILLGAQRGADRVLAAATTSRAALESCTGKLADVNSRWTLIMDKPAAVPAAQLFHGMVAVSPGEALTGAAVPQARWEIPAKVEPFVAGAWDGAVYYYWNPETRELDGPHVPQRTGNQ